MSETERPLSFQTGFNTREPDEETIKVGDPMPRLASVAYHDGMEVAVSWRSGLRTGKADIVDLAPAIMTYKLYRPLRDDAELLKSVHVTADGAAIAWGTDDAIDMAATTVERLAEETMDSSDFRAWLERHAFTYEAAAAHLGISRRLVGYYASRRRVPRYIALACRYIDSLHSTQAHSSSQTHSLSAISHSVSAIFIGEGTLSANAEVRDRLSGLRVLLLTPTEQRVLQQVLRRQPESELSEHSESSAVLGIGTPEPER
jgi:hypothetical protein